MKATLKKNGESKMLKDVVVFFPRSLNYDIMQNQPGTKQWASWGKKAPKG